MIKIDATKAAELAINNRKTDIHAELDDLDRKKIKADREGDTVLFNDLESQRQTLITEIRDLLK